MIINADKKRNNTFPQMMPEVYICWSRISRLHFFYQPLYLCCLLHFEFIWSAGLKVSLLMVNGTIIRIAREGLFDLLGFLSSDGSFFSFFSFFLNLLCGRLFA